MEMHANLQTVLLTFSRELALVHLKYLSHFWDVQTNYMPNHIFGPCGSVHVSLWYLSF